MSTNKILGTPGIVAELHIVECYHTRMETIFKISHEPKTLELQKTEDGRYRLLITLKKLGAVTALEFFLDPEEAQQLSAALVQ